MKKKPQAPKENLRTAFQKGEERWILRSQIKVAPYNPRIIGEGAEKRIRAKIKNVGLLGTLIWNERTGNLVSGHQRLKQLDKLEGYPQKNNDYELRVSAVDLDDKTEKEMVVFLNNPSAMGEWDLEALAAMNLDDGIDFDDMGFTEADVDFLFDGNSRFTELFEDTESVKETKSTLKKIKKERKDYIDRIKEEQSAQYYFVVVCQNRKARNDLMQSIGVPIIEQFVNGAILARKLGVEVDEN